MTLILVLKNVGFLGCSFQKNMVQHPDSGKTLSLMFLFACFVVIVSLEVLGIKNKLLIKPVS